MAFVSVIGKNVGDTLLASDWNTYLQGNLNWINGTLTGTNSQAITILDSSSGAVAGPAYNIKRGGNASAASLYFNNDTAMYVFNSVTNGSMLFAAGNGTTGATTVYTFNHYGSSNLMTIDSSANVAVGGALSATGLTINTNGATFNNGITVNTAAATLNKGATISGGAVQINEGTTSLLSIKPNGGSANATIGFNNSNGNFTFDLTALPVTGLFEFRAVTGGIFRFLTNGVVAQSIDGNGLVTGKGMFTSATTSFGAGAGGSIAHGLSAAPRFYSAVWATTNIVGNRPCLTQKSTPGASDVAITQVDSTNIVITNGTAANAYVTVYCML